MKLIQTLSTLVLAVASALPAVQAQEWPNKPVRVVTAFAAGSASDILARMVAEDFQGHFKQSFVVDNKPGASGIIAAENVAKSPADGYTLFLTTNTVHSANPYLFKKLPYDPIKDFTPIGRLGYAPFVLAVKSDFPAKNVQELMAYARKPENKASYAYGNSTGQVAGAAFTSLTRINASAVPYKSTPQALTDLIGGQVTFLFVDLASSRPHVQSGRVRALALSAEQKSALAADLPTVAEQANLPGFDLAAWIGVVGPAAMPPAIVNKLSERLAAMLVRKDVAERLAFGLAGYAFTRSLKNADLLARRVEVGMLWINMPALPSAEMPFGGIKDSGYGSEGGPEAMDAYLNARAVTIMNV